MKQMYKLISFSTCADDVPSPKLQLASFTNSEAQSSRRTCTQWDWRGRLGGAWR